MFDGVKRTKEKKKGKAKKKYTYDYKEGLLIGCKTRKLDVAYLLSCPSDHLDTEGCVNI